MSDASFKRTYGLFSLLIGWRKSFIGKIKDISPIFPLQ